LVQNMGRKFSYLCIQTSRRQLVRTVWEKWASPDDSSQVSCCGEQKRPYARCQSPRGVLCITFVCCVSIAYNIFNFSFRLESRSLRNVSVFKPIVLLMQNDCYIVMYVTMCIVISAERYDLQQKCTPTREYEPPRVYNF